MSHTQNYIAPEGRDLGFDTMRDAEHYAHGAGFEVTRSGTTATAGRPDTDKKHELRFDKHTKKYYWKGIR